MTIQFSNPIDIYQVPLTQRRGPSLASFGDSITANGVGTSGNIVNNNGLGYSFWMNALTGYRFYSPTSLNFGVSGDKLSDMLARISTVTAARPDICVVHGGTNSLSADVSYANCISQLGQIYDALQAVGCTVIAIPILGRADAVLTSQQRIRGIGINNWIKQQANTRRNFFVADCGLTFDDPTSATWASQSGLTYSPGLHPSPNGAFAGIAARVANILNNISPDTRVQPANQNDTYDATDNIKGNMLNNGPFAGGASTATSTSLSTTAALGVTAAASKGTNSDNRNIQTLTLSGTTTGGSNGQIFLSQGFSAGALAGLQAGDEIEASVEVRWSGGFTNIAYPYFEMRTTESAVVYQRQAGVAQLANPYGIASTSGFLKWKTPSRVLTATPSAASIQLGFYLISPITNGQSVTGVIDFMSAEVRKIN